VKVQANGRIILGLLSSNGIAGSGYKVGRRLRQGYTNSNQAAGLQGVAACLGVTTGEPHDAAEARGRRSRARATCLLVPKFNFYTLPRWPVSSPKKDDCTAIGALSYAIPADQLDRDIVRHRATRSASTTHSSRSAVARAPPPVAKQFPCALGDSTLEARLSERFQDHAATGWLSSPRRPRHSLARITTCAEHCATSGDGCHMTPTTLIDEAGGGS
jgi:hypothetical protein